jgi:hypothetical protein
MDGNGPLLPSIRVRRLIVLIVAFGAVLTALPATPAIAQEDGVFYDDDDAAGKEYAIPTDEGRRGGHKGGGDNGGGSSDPSGGDGAAGEAGADGADGGDEPRSGEGTPLFGSGISKKGAVEGASRSSRSLPPQAAIESAGSGTSPFLWMAGLAVLVLALGAGGAYAVKRRRSA